MIFNVAKLHQGCNPEEDTEETCDYELKHWEARITFFSSEPNELENKPYNDANWIHNWVTKEKELSVGRSIPAVHCIHEQVVPCVSQVQYEIALNDKEKEAEN